MTPNTRVEKKIGHVENKLDNEFALMHIDSGTIFALREVAAYVWANLESPKTVSELVESIVNAYDVEPSRCQSDLEQLLEDLAEKDLVQLS